MMFKYRIKGICVLVLKEAPCDEYVVEWTYNATHSRRRPYKEVSGQLQSHPL
jgi:hypothetical protein